MLYEKVINIRDREEESIWKPKTEVGMKVFEGTITNIDEIFSSGKKISEPEIADRLLTLKSEIIFIGGSPGKGGGIKRTTTRRTVRMHRSGRRYKVSALVVVGDSNGHIGIGKASAVEHSVAIEKATQAAKLNIIPVKRGCGSWECGCKEGHSIPVSINGKSGSVNIALKPAPKGVGLCVNDEAKKMMRLAGINDIWCSSFGDTRSRVNYAFALFKAFKKINRMKM
ncbi:MAG TPA: 30S ribosomal protein S5 [archaeon]|nr:30S ribosomal protein S5 [archaeon]